MASSFHDQLMQINQIGDVQSWLTNKFGDGTESWSDKVSIFSQLNKEVLRDIRKVFHTLHINVKLKFLLYILHIPQTLLEKNKHEIDAIISDSLSSPDPWVNEIANLIKNFRKDGSISFDSPRFCELVSDIKKNVKKQGDKGILPYEAMFMNKTAFQTTFGQLQPLQKHFTLQKRAKSAALRQELLQKANDLANGKRSNSTGSAAIRCRGMNIASPMKGIPSRSLYEKRSQFSSSFGGFGAKSLLDRQNSINKFSRYPSGSTAKREGGIVLLESCEAPPIDVRKRKLNSKETKAESKKSSKEPEIVTETKLKEDSQVNMASEAAAAVDSISPVVAHKSSVSSDNGHKEPEKRPPLLPASLESVVSQTATKSTPDYAAGLINAPSNRFNDLKSHSHQSTLSSLLTAPPVSNLSDNTSHSYPISSTITKTDSIPNTLSPYSGQNNNSQQHLQSSPVVIKPRNNMYSRFQGQKNSSPAAQIPTINPTNDNNNSKTFDNFGSFGQRNSSGNELARSQMQEQQHSHQPQQTSSNIYRPMMGLQNSSVLQQQHHQQSQIQQSQQLSRPQMSQQQQQSQASLQPAHQSLHQASHLQHTQQQQSPMLAHTNSLRLSNSVSSTSSQLSSILSSNLGVFQQNSQPQMSVQPRHLALSQPPPPPSHHQHIMAPNGIRSHQILQQQQQQQALPQQQFAYGISLSHSEPESRHSTNHNPYGLIRINSEATANELTADIWSKSNYLCNDERNLILNFLKGTLDNPIPNCGNSAMLKYYEQIEVTQIPATAPSVSVHIEMYFLMNFDTREWKKFRSVKPVARDLQINNDRNINKIRFILPPPAEQMSNNWHLFESGIGMPLQIERPPAYNIHSPGIGHNYRTLGNTH